MPTVSQCFRLLAHVHATQPACSTQPWRMVEQLVNESIYGRLPTWSLRHRAVLVNCAAFASQLACKLLPSRCRAAGVLRQQQLTALVLSDTALRVHWPVNGVCLCCCHCFCCLSTQPGGHVAHSVDRQAMSQQWATQTVYAQIRATRNTGKQLLRYRRGALATPPRIRYLSGARKVCKHHNFARCICCTNLTFD